MISGEKEAVAVAKSLINLTIDLNNMKRARESSDAQNMVASNPSIMRTNPWQHYEIDTCDNLVTYPHLQPAMVIKPGMQQIQSETGMKRESGHGYATGNRSNDGYG